MDTCDTKQTLIGLLSVSGALILFLLASSSARAQSFCNVSHDGSSYGGGAPCADNFDPSNASIDVRIFFHIEKDATGQPGYSDSEVDDILSILQNDFASGGITFTEVGRKVVEGGSVDEKDSRIDIRLYPPDSSTMVAGLANVGGGDCSLDGDFVTLWDMVPDVSEAHVASHEVGHTLGLYHTHGDRNCLENENGTNCSTTSCGDFICDTPPDPYLGSPPGNKVGPPPDCVFDPIDPDEEVYDPDTENIMSYTCPECMAHFTSGQFARMLSSSIRNNQRVINSIIFKNSPVVHNDLTIQDGVTLTVQSGATVSFKSGAGLNINGTLNATGATFTATGNDWDGIYFASGSSGNLDGVTIEGTDLSLANAEATLFVDGTDDVDLYDLTLHNLAGSGPAVKFVDVNSSYIDNASTITHDDGAAVYLDNAGHEPGGATYDGCASCSSPETSSALYAMNGSDVYTYNGGTLTGSDYGFYATGGVYAQAFSLYFQYDPPTEDVYAAAYNSSSLDVRYGCWSDNYNYGGGPAPSTLDTDGTSSITWDPPSTDVCNGGSSPSASEQQTLVASGAVESGESLHSSQERGGAEAAADWSNKLRKAQRARYEERFDEARRFYEEVLADAQASSQAARLAVAGLAWSYRQSGQAAMLDPVTARAESGGPLQTWARRVLLNTRLSENDEQAVLNAAKRLAESGGAEEAAYAEAARATALVRAGRAQEAQKIASAFAHNHAQAAEKAATRRIERVRRALKRHEEKSNQEAPEASLEKPDAQVAKVRDAAPNELKMESAYPNPTRGRATVPLSLPEAAEVQVGVYDVLGRQVATLADERYESGRHRLRFEDESLPSGVYVIRARVEATSGEIRVFTRKVTFVQ